MKDGFVADSSVGVAWAVLSQSTEATVHLRSEVAAGTPFVVPALWPFEVANSLLVLARRKRIEPEQYARARHALNLLTPTIDDEGTRAALGLISEMAEKHELSVYDATYLELAIRKALPLASRDATLNKAARLAGLKTLLY